MSVPDHQLDPSDKDRSWCSLCGHDACQCWHDFYVQQKFDDAREEHNGERESQP
jgi:hypothetical protein